jgi:6-phosphogluconolactonase
VSARVREVLPVAPADFTVQVTALVAAAMRQAIAARGACRVVLAGGRSPRGVYAALAARQDIPWDAVTFFIGDERCVPATHDDSNFRMIRTTLLDALPAHAAQVHPWRTELGAEAASRAYDALIAALPEPKFDVVLSGVGPDGHTASLFPGDPRVGTADTWAMRADAPPAFAVPERVTLTVRALNASRLVVLLCTGADKRAVRDVLLRDPSAAARLPASQVHGLERTMLVVDPE